MGRRNRSSSFVKASPTNSSTNNANNTALTVISSGGGPTPENLSAATTLLQQFVHSHSFNNYSEGGRTPFLTAVRTAASNITATNNQYNNNEKEREQMDALFVVDGLATRMKEMDALLTTSSSSSLSVKRRKKRGSNSNNSSRLNTSGHFHQLMTTRDKESGYTPLHYAIVQRDLMTMLLLLKHASMPSLEREVVLSSLEQQKQKKKQKKVFENGADTDVLLGGGGDIRSSSCLNLHPLRLLHGNLHNNNDDSNAHNDEESNPYYIINDVTSTTDKEGLTPLQLLGKSSSGGLEHCRRSLTWRALRDGWLKQQRRQRQHHPRQHQVQQGGISTLVSGGASSFEETSPTAATVVVARRYRRRMISFGDDRDYDSLQYDIESGDDDDGNNNNNDDDWNHRQGRGRGGSFSIHLNDDDDDDDDQFSDDESGGGGENNNDLIPLDGEVDFNVLADTRVNAQQRERQQYQYSPTNNNDYGCEVLTFGRADHCALGVPQLSSRIRSDYNGGKGGKEDGNNFFSSSSFDKTYKPKRVETFALGELRRDWSSSTTSSKKRDRRNEIDSPAVAVAASTHHTLVATRTGQLFSFGLGKGGRLGLGDESHRPLPTRILGPLSKRIVASIAAAENHSLCSTSDGAVFAWGSNGFGQLGIHSSRGNSPQNNQDGAASGGSRLSPRRVEGELKHSFVVGVACGERHSVALTRLGEVYCWGDNKKGQLGVINVSETQSNGPQRVEGLWSVHPRRRAIAVSAAAYSTLVLTMPPTISAGAERESSLVSLPVNTIYGWGHGNHTPLRVIFPTGNSFASQSGSPNAYSRMICINPIAIACAKYHNVAITKDGKVYTWGLHSDSLGVPQQASSTKQKSRSNSGSSSSMISSPQLVTGMLPENGGGNAVAVSASESHTAIVTSDGHVFNWGESEGKDVLGHKGVRWQPSPRRVKRVHRAVAVAAGKEHTVMLIGTTFPPLPNANSAEGALSLQHSAAIEISRNVDLFNVLPLALVAYRFNCRPLINFCDKFIRSNLDGVLAVGMKNDFDAFLSSRTIVGTSDYEHDGMFHPSLHLMVNMKRWVYSGKALLKQYESTIAPPAKKVKKSAVYGERKPSCSPSKEEEEDKRNRIDQRKVGTAVKITPEEDASKDNESITPPHVKNAPKNEPKESPPVPTPTARGKFYCDLCGISCPDSDSYTFHIHGRKHRNRQMHAEAAEEKSVAESMMAMKRMQLVEKGGDKHARVTLERDTKRNDRSSIAWGTQHANFTGGLAPMTPQKGKSFQDILKEEQNKMTTVAANRNTMESSPYMGMKSPASLTPAKTKPAFVSSPAPGRHSKSTTPMSAHASGASPTLGSFLARKAEPKHDGLSGIGASWGATPISKSKNSNLNWGMKQPATKTSPITTQSPSKIRSFSEIQKEEEALRNNEDHMCRIDGNQWFVQQRERAASIGEIQQEEQQEQEMLDLIEEQKQIEMAIMKSIEEEKAAKKMKKQKKEKQNQQRRNKKKQPKVKGASKSKNTILS